MPDGKSKPAPIPMPEIVPEVVAEKPAPPHARGFGCHQPDAANLPAGYVHTCGGCSKQFKLSRVDGIEYWRNYG